MAMMFKVAYMYIKYISLKSILNYSTNFLLIFVIKILKSLENVNYFKLPAKKKRLFSS